MQGVCKFSLFLSGEALIRLAIANGGPLSEYPLAGRQGLYEKQF
jgi:hypothetical protein